MQLPSMQYHTYFAWTDACDPASLNRYVIKNRDNIPDPLALILWSFFFSFPSLFMQGLSTAVLQAAADAVNDEVGNRECYIVVKNGKIVHEQYYLGM